MTPKQYYLDETSLDRFLEAYTGKDVSRSYDFVFLLHFQPDPNTAHSRAQLVQYYKQNISNLRRMRAHWPWLQSALELQQTILENLDNLLKTYTLAGMLKVK
jgi:hypothetical protein